MDPTYIGILGIIVLLCTLFILGMPVGFAMAIVGFCGYCYIVNIKAGLGMLGTEIWNLFSKYGFTVIPLFIFMGQVAFYSGVNERLYSTAYKWVGHIRGGLAMATVMACAAFAAICGSNAATAATMTSVAYPQMKRYQYSPQLSTGTIACGSTLGVVIPPSVVLIIIGLSTGLSIAKLFYGALVAGVLLCILMILGVYVVCKIHPEWGPQGEASTWKERFKALPGSVEMLILFLSVMLGLYFGVFTPTEAGAVGSFLALVIALIQRKLSWQGFVSSVMDTLRVSAMVIMIVAGAVIFGKFLAVTRIPFQVASWAASLPVPGMVVLGIIFVIYIIGGMVMDALALLLITIPIFYPVVEKLGYDPLWFSIEVTVITTLGAVTPPVAATAYVVGGMAKDVKLEEVFKGVIYLLPTYVLAIVIMMAFPKLITFLPNLVR